MNTIVTFSGKKFGYCLKVVKKLGGKFNATDKSWTIPGKLESCFIEDFDSVRFVEQPQSVGIEEIYRDWDGNENSKY